MTDALEKVTPPELAEALRGRIEIAEADLTGYWYQVLGDREQYANSLRDELRDSLSVIAVVRGASFDNPHALLNDFMEVVEKCKEQCLDKFSVAPRGSKLSVVLLARAEMRMPQLSSPATVPDWFPHIGGTEIRVRIEDLTWRAEVGLAADEGAVARLRQSIFDLEGGLLERLVAVFEADRTSGQALWSALGAHGERYDDFLAIAAQSRTDVRDPSSFRPSLREGRSLVARLWRQMQKTHPEGVPSFARKLSQALRLPEEIDFQWHQTMAHVVGRSTNPPSTSAEKFSCNLLSTLSWSCQLTTAAAHSDAYPLFPIQLLKSFYLDLRLGLADANKALRVLERI
ncbi:hypothetical protein [Actinoplanes sp. NPDC020271]|uniref:hypothetical protein n=1 Tax=Actinoplanes sp. NPDC020271 TaxID=3363896 RepID=UPI003789248E